MKRRSDYDQKGRGSDAARFGRDDLPRNCAWHRFLGGHSGFNRALVIQRLALGGRVRRLAISDFGGGSAYRSKTNIPRCAGAMFTIPPGGSKKTANRIPK